MEKLDKLIAIGVLSFSAIFLILFIAFIIAVITEGRKVRIRMICIMLLGTFFPIPDSWGVEVARDAFPWYFRQRKKRKTKPEGSAIQVDLLYDLINQVDGRGVLSMWLTLMGTAAGGAMYWLFDTTGRMCLNIVGIRWFYLYGGVLFWLVIHTVVQLGIYFVLINFLQKHDNKQS